jgi:hypothetical protein
MRIRRGPLFWGLLLIPLGAIPLLARAGFIDTAAFVDAWRLWPLILVGVGIAIMLGNRRAGLAATVTLALVLGIVGGGALASGAPWAGNFGSCVSTSASTDRLTKAGAFEAAASVDLELDCGRLGITTAVGSAWSLSADYLGSEPIVTATGSSLRIATPNQTATHRQDWSLELPAAPLRDLSIRANAAAVTLDLEGAALERFRADVNAGDLRIDAGGARINRLDISMNAGRARITLADGTTIGSLAANAGAIELCVPTGAGLVLRVTDQLTFGHNLAGRGLARDGDTWRRTAASDANIDLTINGNAASFTLDPDGGC